MKILPKPEVLNEQIEDKESIYKCFNCNKEFSGKEMKFQDGLPDNFHVAGLDQNQKIPQCPHCGVVAFFGFEEGRKERGIL